MTEFEFRKSLTMETRGQLFEIRLANSNDSDQIIHNVNEVIAEGSLLAVDKFALNDDWHKCLSRSGAEARNPYILAVATTCGRVTGHCRLFPVEKSECGLNSGEVGFVLDSKYRNSGIGSALLSYVLILALSHGYQKATLHTASENVPAIRLGRKFGFIEVGRRTKRYFLQGRYMDEIMLARLL